MRKHAMENAMDRNAKKKKSAMENAPDASYILAPTLLYSMATQQPYALTTGVFVKKGARPPKDFK